MLKKIFNVFPLLLYQNRSSNSVVGVLTRLQGGLLGGLIPERGLAFISFHNKQTGSRAHLASCLMGMGVSFPGSYISHEADHSLPSNAMVKDEMSCMSAIP